MQTVATINREKIHSLCRALSSSGKPVKIMEVCGTHTVAIARSGLRKLLPESLKLISGPGCPVCVTDGAYLDQALALARGEVTGPADKPIVATYGDMVRVPGRSGSLSEARALGASVEVVYGADQAVDLARDNPARQVVFLAVGFETTSPGTALAVLRAKNEGLRNFTVFTAHKLVVPAMRALLAGGGVQVDAFLCPGHVSVILGYGAFDPIAALDRRPCVVAGFDPRQILEGVAEILSQLKDGRPSACTVYPAVTREGNSAALKILDEVFETSAATWRSLGTIPGSGMVLREEFAEYDAARRFLLPVAAATDDGPCRCGAVITGQLSPVECPLFAKRCTPRDPVGPCMVSSEGACAAAYKYGL